MANSSFGFCDRHAVWNYGKECPVCKSKKSSRVEFEVEYTKLKQLRRKVYGEAGEV